MFSGVQEENSGIEWVIVIELLLLLLIKSSILCSSNRLKGMLTDIYNTGANVTKYSRVD